jgi:hypothetical protein
VADFKVTDRRGSRNQTTSGNPLVVARGAADVQRALALGRQGSASADQSELRHAAQVRNASEKLRTAGMGGSSMQFATTRPLDPMFYWRETGMPYDVDDEKVLVDLRKWCRFIYRSDSVLASCIDIYSKYPLLGMELQCKSQSLVDFYSSLMFEDLNYEDYLIDIGREYWTVGEAWPMGYFDELLGIWESDELLQPDDISVEKSPFLKEPRFFMKLPESIRRTLVSKQPKWEYESLIRSYPDLKDFAVGTERQMPVSNVLLKQFKFTGDTFNPRGLPILLRALRPCIQEEMLNAAQDAIASRFYTPLIHARIGASATDLGTQAPWIPQQSDIQNFLADMDAALAADFRVLATHFAVELSSVFGRENMPNLDDDFDRLKERKLQAFGLSEAMLSGAGQGETYAADALNRDLVSQLLTTYQRKHKRFMKDRMLVVAEAQGHYDYRESGGKRRTIYEEVLVVTEDGERIIEEQPKLLVPDVSMASMSMRSEAERAQFIEALRASGVPISMRTRMRAMSQVGLNFDDEIESTLDEQVRLTVEEQEVRKAKFLALQARGLPIPDDLAQDFMPKVINADQIQQQQAVQNSVQQAQMGAEMAPAATSGDPMAPGGDPSQQQQPAMPPGEQIGTDPTRTPQLGVDDGSTPNLAPTPQELMSPPGAPITMPPGGPGDAAIDPVGDVIPLPRNKARPDESDEQRDGMPTPMNASKLSFLNDPRHLGSGRHRRRVAPAHDDEQEAGEG